MLIVIGHKSVKVFLKALKFLAKYSSEYVLEVSNNKFHIKTCSATQISLAVATFDELFFVKYEASSDPEENTCRISAKILLNVLKNAKSIASLTLKINIPEDCLYVNLHKFNDFVVKNKISLLEFEQFENYTLPNDMSEVTLHPSVLRRVLQSSKGIDELEFDFKFDNATVRTFIDQPEEDCDSIRLDYRIDVSEFSSYKIKAETLIIASCNEFVILLNLAQSMDMELLIQFTVPGRPMISVLKIDGSYTMSLIQATLVPKSSKRLVRNHSYKKMFESFMGKRFELDDEDTQINNENDNESNPALKNSKKVNSKETDKSNRSKGNNSRKSVSEMCLPTHSKIVRAKRKSVDECRVEEIDVDATQDNLIQKRRRTLDSTVIGGNSSIVLSQAEMSEVNDIIADIEEFCQIPHDDDVEMNQHIELPQPKKSNLEQNDENRPQNEVIELKNTEYTDKMNTDDPFSHERWPMHNSYFGADSENIEKQGNIQIINAKSRHRKEVESLFNHLFKPKSKTQFGTVVIPGSDSESEEIL